MTTHPAGHHLRLLAAAPQDTEPLESYELMTSEIPRYLGAPLLPPVDRVRYVRLRRFDRTRTFLDTNPVVDAAFYIVAMLSLFVSLAVLGAL